MEHIVKMPRLYHKSDCFICLLVALGFFQLLPLAIAGRPRPHRPLQAQGALSYTPSLAGLHDRSVIGYLELNAANKHIVLTGTNWTNSSAIAVKDLGVKDARFGRIEDRAGFALNPAVAFMYVRTQGSNFRRVGSSALLRPDDVVIISANVADSVPKQHTLKLHIYNRKVETMESSACPTPKLARVGDKCIPCHEGSESSAEIPWRCICKAGFGAKAAISSGGEDHVYKLLPKDISFSKQLHWLVPKAEWRSSQEIKIKGAERIYITGIASNRSRILKKVHGFSSFINAGKETRCFSGDIIKIEIRGAETHGKSSLFVHIISSQQSNTGSSLQYFNTLGDGTRLSNGFMLNHDGSHCELCETGHKSAENRDNPCVRIHPKEEPVCPYGKHFEEHALACKPNVCTCHGGAVAYENQCAQHGSVMCISCNPGFFLNDESRCISNVCHCPEGQPATGSSCLVNGDQSCANCSTTGYFLKGNRCIPWSAPCSSEEIESQAPTMFQDRVCKKNVTCDVHPCLEGPYPCDAHAKCIESKLPQGCGSYSCHCISPYFGNGNTCKILSIEQAGKRIPPLLSTDERSPSNTTACDIHPCMNDPCDPHAECKESDRSESCGSYSCHCITPFYGDGNTCKMMPSERRST